MPELIALPQHKTRNILRMDNELSGGDIEEMIKCLRFKYPRIDAQVTLSTFEVGLDSDLLVLCRLRRYSGNPNRIYSPKWYKPKLEGWIIVVALHDSEKMMAMKRVRVQRSWRTTKIKVLFFYSKNEETISLTPFCWRRCLWLSKNFALCN